MPPIVKENETLTGTPESGRSASTSTSSGDAAAKQQPVALEVAVTVNGARTIDGSDKREPFSETTKTVLIFGNGAVIRLTSSVAPGQLLFLTNERTKKEVVCQVVKSKNYRNVSGYVELEFTEPVVGFWGMRFPGDRLGSATPSAPAAVSSPMPTRSAAPSALPTPTYSTSPATHSSPTSSQPSSIVPAAIDSASLLGAAKSKASETRPPASPVIVAPPVVAPPPVAAQPPSKAMPQAPKEAAEPASLMASGPNFDLPRQADEQASFLAPAQASKSSSVDLSSLARFFEVKPAPSGDASAVPQVQVPIDTETEELKQHTARLQEQLSSMQFAEPEQKAPVKSAPQTPVREKKEFQESIAQVLEMAKPAAPKPDPVFAAPIEPVKTVSEKKISSLEEEELQIPAWLEPLARNASAPSSTQELVLREKAKRLAEQSTNDTLAEEEVVAPPPVIPALDEERTVPEARVPEFGSALAIDENTTPETHTKGSNKGLLFGAIAAGVLLAAGGGWWYLNQQPAAAKGDAPVASAAVSNPVTSSPTKTQTATPTSVPAVSEPSVVSKPAKETGSATQANVASKPGNAAPSLSAVSVRSTQPSSNPAGKPIATPLNTPARQPEPAAEEEKKSSLGQVKLAAPKVTQRRTLQSAEPDGGVSLDSGQTENASDALGAGLSAGKNEPAAPAAPLAVGGDVKQAKLISSVAPLYPALAKNQHISGNVTIDALIDANGRVTTMKVISGPTLLQQAAMDALKMWKYQPAMLDGKAVPMHLTVTLQFHLQ